MEPFIQPTTATTILFVALCLSVVASWIWGIRTAAPEWTRRALTFIAAWLILTVGLSKSIQPGDLSALRFFGLSNVLAVVLALSPVGARMATLPLAALVAYQWFRLPLEIVLHQWAEGGTIPFTMTWEGRNFDVITGILATAFGLWAWSRPLPRAAAWAFQVVGFSLLLNVGWTAVGSAPTPLRRYFDGPPIQLPYHLPYAYIVSICVAGALFGHIVLFRALLGEKARR